ncbi:Hypothetical predicted protein, partial [Paramuricea clavata]
MPPKKSDERILFERYSNLTERLKNLIETAQNKLDKTCPREVAKALSTAIFSLIKVFEEGYLEWLSSNTTFSEDIVNEQKKSHNDLAMRCDNILIDLSVAGDDGQVPEKTNDAPKSRLPKVEFRCFNKAQPKLWFEQLEVVFASSSISSSEQKFAALLRLMDDSTSSLLCAITREKAPTAYEDAKALLIKEFSLSRFDRVKAYLEAAPAPDEKLTLFNSRIESLVDGLCFEDVSKFCLLRYAPPAVRLQLSGSGFDD